ncbi:MAG: cysteine--tRNA ligase [Firmicutes bacterium]|nr:cysteine--tRNA ligase [Bacillota bacterium]
MKLYNTLSKKVEEFIPRDKNSVKMYTCGPTVYNYAHIGNLRTYIFEDVLEKSMNYLGYPVKRTMNITDVGHLSDDGDNGEDKMLKGAIREKKTVWEIAQYYTDAFFEDCKKLNIKKPEIVSKASNHIEDYIHMVEKLLKDGYAYQANGNVYFDVSKMSNYYELSGKNPDDLKVAVRSDVEHDTFKKNPADFGLWFTNSKFNNQAMKWESPWGVGYPGWHIECSNIAIHFLGEYLDIHCGGVDNIFPHHSNEIAQSEAYLGHKWCNYWAHGEYLNDETGKMSKSKGEFLTVSLLESKGYDPLSYRYFCLESHYRKQLAFSYASLDRAVSSYQSLKNKVRNLKEIEDMELETDKFQIYQDKFKACISDDLNTANALTVLYEVLKSDCNDKTKLALTKDFDQVLSLSLLEKEELSEEETAWVLERIEARSQAKREKNFSLADAIREELKEKGIQIKDTREGTVFEKIN